MGVCDRCGYALTVERVVVLVNGKATVEVDACLHCRTELLADLALANRLRRAELRVLR